MRVWMQCTWKTWRDCKWQICFQRKCLCDPCGHPTETQWRSTVTRWGSWVSVYLGYFQRALDWNQVILKRLLESLIRTSPSTTTRHALNRISHLAYRYSVVVEIRNAHSFGRWVMDYTENWCYCLLKISAWKVGHCLRWPSNGVCIRLSLTVHPFCLLEWRTGNLTG